VNSSRMLITLSVVEIAAFVAVLALFLQRLTGMLGMIAANLGGVASGVKAIEGHLTILEAVPAVNTTLDEIAEALPLVARAANAKATRR
jgi:hypothetical protein